jgi:RNA methyltransferase, TrmH family
MSPELITSFSNPKVKLLSGLMKKPALRKETRTFVVEGEKEIHMALEAGYEPEQLFISENALPSKNGLDKIPQTLLSSKIFESLSYRNGKDGLLAVFRFGNHDLNGFRPGARSLIIILEAVEKPGNLGAVMRCADGAGVDAVIVCDPKTDIYNPNVIRSGVGCLFTVPLFLAGVNEVLDFCKKNNIAVYAASPEAKENYWDLDFKGSTALAFGTEADGLSDSWNAGAKHFKIPMRGKNDSLNVSVSTGIVIYEVLRQRREA